VSCKYCNRGRGEEFMRFCPKCGKEISEGIVFCPYCGSKLAVNVEALKLKMEDLRHNEIAGIMIVILGIVLLAVGAWLGSITAVKYEWQGPICIEITYHPFAEAAIATLIAAALIVFTGLGCVVWYSYKRSKLMKRIESL
jgi:RNA polymerase subunit RPABC4/transcription elongation factor Spt4